MLAVAKGTTMEELAKKSMPWSSSWKDVHMKIHGTSEELILPVMVSSKVGDVKQMLGEMVNANPSSIEFIFKLGPTYKRHRAGDEISSKITVKGIKSFGNKAIVWPDPFGIIGCGTIGLRMSVQMCRYGYDFCCFERMHQIGGNAWLGIANPTSKLQTEGPHYQLQYDPVDGNLFGMLPLEKYGYWPSRAEIIKHHEEVCRIFGASAYTKLSTEVVDIVIPGGHTTGPFDKLKDKSFSMEWKSTKDGDSSEGSFKASCIFTYPGCLVVPHRKTWPGEDICEMNIGYGFSSEFDYTKIEGQDALMVGMGAFAHENVRTFCESGGSKCYVVARHFNLMLPRAICWWMNQATCPPTGAMCLNAMKPMYDLLNWDPWKFFSVVANEDRTVANIKQFTRWGISDVFFVCQYYGKAEVIGGEVKRFKERAAVLTNGQILEDCDHCMKVIGFDADFSVDRVMHTKEHIGHMPDGDPRRWVMSDTSAIDASRFNGVNLSPGGVFFCYHPLHYATHPKDGEALVNSKMLPVGKQQIEAGSPCYHFMPRDVLVIGSITCGFNQAGREWDALNDVMKKESMLGNERIEGICTPERYHRAIKSEWDHYCLMLEDAGCTHVKRPPYPYNVQDLYKLMQLERDLRLEEEQKAAVRQGRQQPQDWGGQGGDAPKLPFMSTKDPLAYEPMKAVMAARMRSPSSGATNNQLRDYYAEGQKVKQHLLALTGGIQPFDAQQ
mmetsp:Transcript_106189/g.226677  ORF Transcript_106189/g.226677 Transcript_106189/m.226677 type:complete len:722 (-) Transcript_106189:49-2214(-)